MTIGQKANKAITYLWAKITEFQNQGIFVSKESWLLLLGLCHKSLNYSAIRYSSKNGARKQIKMGTRWHGLALCWNLWSKHHTHFQLWSRHLQGEGLWHKDEDLGTWVRSLWHRDDLSKVMLGFSTNYAPFYVDVTGPVPSVLSLFIFPPCCKNAILQLRQWNFLYLSCREWSQLLV